MRVWWSLAAGDRTGKRETVWEEQFGGGYRRETTVEWSPRDTSALLGMLTSAVEQGVPPRVLKKFFNRFGSTAKIALAETEGLPEPVAVLLAQDSSVEVRKTLARRRRIPDAALMILASDKNYKVRHVLARNTEGSPRWVLRKLYRERARHDPDGQVRELVLALAANTRTPGDIHSELLRSDDIAISLAAVGNTRTTAT
jgi:hypothetical protein